MSENSTQQLEEVTAEAAAAETMPVEGAEHAEAKTEEGSIKVSLKPEVLFNIGPMPITNSMIAAYSVSFFLIILTFIGTRRLKTVPGKLQLFIETAFTTGYDFVKNTTNNERLTKTVFPLFMTLVLFFWTANMANFIPGLLAIEYHGHHFYRPALADYALVLSLALLVFIFSQVTILRFAGIKIYIKKYLNYSSPIAFFVGILEFIGEFARILSLSFRLFGNIFSEEVLMIVMLSIAPFIAPLPFAMLGLLTSTIQALLFPMLVLLFLNIAVEESNHAKHEAKQKLEHKFNPTPQLAN
ncbi:MAG: hypothetical protein ACD_43C00024G0005 [uncultured bacterium]|nr:MAG: hypothetical protein ACD_43C00024G0005 [uncultured bacterium]